eukprot:gene11179-20120_t
MFEHLQREAHFLRQMGQLPRFPYFFGPLIAKDCAGFVFNETPKDGVFLIQPNSFSSKKLQVFCSFENANDGWIVIQRRVNGSTSFDRLWQEYQQGFGDLQGNYWIGLDKLNLIAGPGLDAMLRIDIGLSDSRSDILYAIYNRFAVDDETMNYRLTVSEYNKSSTLPDSLNHGDILKSHNGKMFSTKDKDNDKDSYKNCALEYTGGKTCFGGLFGGRVTHSDVYPRRVVTDGESGSVEEQYGNEDETIDDDEEAIDGIPLEAIVSRVEGRTTVNEW